ncbi:MAG: GntR family transcriptional regulator [Phycisphaerae bacterium]|nr:GntR family transcriptional regulator [Phycisphaerae bacterium]
MKMTRRRISEILQSDILAGKYPSGKRLTQPKLARRFGVSHGLIRESFMELQSLGLVEMRENLGTFVRGFDAGRMIEILSVREMLEALAVRECCEKALPFELDDLENLAREKYEFDKAGGDKYGSESLDRKFHARLARYSRNETLLQALMTHEILIKRVYLYRDPKGIYEDHRQIVEAIRRNQPDEAERLIRAHVRTNIEAIRKGKCERLPMNSDSPTDSRESIERYPDGTL